uniref:Uncharacterized protein n=1 Tax=Romanomermis culicivorax TaxID=13658 RepID=A0A915I5U2_ROMCU
MPGARIFKDNYIPSGFCLLYGDSVHNKMIPCSKVIDEKILKEGCLRMTRNVSGKYDKASCKFTSSNSGGSLGSTVKSTKPRNRGSQTIKPTSNSNMSSSLLGRSSSTTPKPFKSHHSLPIYVIKSRRLYSQAEDLASMSKDLKYVENYDRPIFVRMDDKCQLRYEGRYYRAFNGYCETIDGKAYFKANINRADCAINSFRNVRQNNDVYQECKRRWDDETTSIISNGKDYKVEFLDFLQQECLQIFIGPTSSSIEPRLTKCSSIAPGFSNDTESTCFRFSNSSTIRCLGRNKPSRANHLYGHQISRYSQKSQTRNMVLKCFFEYCDWCIA